MGSFFYLITKEMTKEKLRLAVVRLIVVCEDQNIYGTGFLFSTKVGGRKKHYILTNKHVVRDGQFVKVNLPVGASQDSGKVETLAYNFERMNSIINHPNSSVDLCAIPLEGAFRQAKKLGKTIVSVAFDCNDLPSKCYLDRLTDVEDVLMIGYPSLGQSPFEYVPPYFAKGITSTNAKECHLGQNEFIVDVNGDGGNSGSPIVAIRKGVDSSNGKIVFYEEFCLLGIVAGGYEYKRTHKIQWPNGSETTIQYEIGGNLFIALPWYRIQEMERVIVRKSEAATSA